MSLNRREFLKTTIAGTGSVLLAQSSPVLEAAAPAAAAQPASKPDPFQPVALGKTGLMGTLIGFGTGMRGGMRETNLTRLGKDNCEALLRYGIERGIRFFDCADLYGTHPYVASALRSIPRDQYLIGTKIWVRPGGIPEKERPDANVVVDRFRKELATDYIDLVQLHCMTDPMWCDQQRRQMDILEELKVKGVIGAHGVSCHSIEALQACAASPWVDVVHTRINALGDSMDVTDKATKTSDPAIVAAVIKQIHDAGKGVIGMKLIGEGRYRNDPAKRDQSIQYVLSLGCVDMMIVGFEKKEEVDDFATRVANALNERRT